MSFFTNLRDRIADAVTRDEDAPPESISGQEVRPGLDDTSDGRTIVETIKDAVSNITENIPSGLPETPDTVRPAQARNLLERQENDDAESASSDDAERILAADRANNVNVTVGDEPEPGATADPEEPEEQPNDQDFSSSGPLKNPLSGFASHTPVISLYVLSKEELRDPDSYRKKPPRFLIARTGGLGNDADITVPTIFEETLGKRVEYFLDDLEINSLLAQTPQTRQTNATTLRFRLKEPYSMGMFLKALQFTVSRADPSRRSYIDPPYLLQIDFKGFDEDGNFVKVPGTTRYIPFKLTNIQFNVSAGGSEYEVEGIAWNDQALADEIQFINNNLSLYGSTVKEFLTNGFGDNERKGLEAFLNKQEDNFVNPDGDNEPLKEKPDKYVISFPTVNDNRINAASEANEGTATDQQSASTDTVTVNSGLGVDEIAQNKQALQNQIGKSKIVVNTDSAGTISDEGDFINLDRVGVRRDGRVLQFSSGMRIQDIIEEIVLLSEYAKDLASLNEKKADTLGYRNWFRIETQVFEQSTEPDKITEKVPKIYVYSVVPYKVESYRFLRTNESLGSSLIERLKQLSPKKYDYIYSGQNDDIINFDIQFNTAFFQGLQQDLGQLSQRNQEGARPSAAAAEAIIASLRVSDNLLDPDRVSDIFDDPDDDFRFFDVETNEETDLPRLAVTAEKVPGSNTGHKGGSAGSGDADVRTTIARNFNEIIVNGLDLITVDLEIWGDPFYIADSGIGNYNAPGTENPFVTDNNTLDYQYFEPICRLEFKTPLDYNEDGGMDFPESQGEAVAEFSGVYKITTVRNMISSNRFTQQLQLIRFKNQEIEDESPEKGPNASVNDQPQLTGVALLQSGQG